MNKIVIIGLIVTLIVIITIFFIFFSNKNNHKIWFNNYDYFYKDKVKYIGTENIIDSHENIKYTFSINIKLDNLGGNAHWNTNDDVLKTIFNGHGSPNIYYNRMLNKCIISLAYKDDENIVNYYDIDFDNFENQQWINLVITINDKKVNIFKNGEFFNSALLPNIHIKSYKRPMIGDKEANFNGYVGYIDYYNYILSRNKIKKLYRKNINKLPNKVNNYYYYEKLEKEEKENEEIKFRRNIFRLA